MARLNWSMLTSLPRRIIGSLGPTKADLATVSNHTFFCSAAELNLIRNWIGWLGEAVGLPTGYAADSLQGRLDALEEADPDAFSVVDHMVFEHPFWLTSSGSPAQASSLTKGWYLFALDGGVAQRRESASSSFQRAFGPSIEARLLCDGMPGGTNGCGIGFRQMGGGDGWGVRIQPTGKMQIWITNGGGTDTYELPGIYVVSTEITFRVYVEGLESVTVQVNGGDEYTLAKPLPSASLVAFVEADAGGDSGKHMFLDYVKIEADFSQAVA